ncbi:cation:proton antiporter [Microbispora bryophytorum]|uniref:cation:proton antiporter n=1 Tax=Microbispora bryophytorum TaxID=1460882 RepID=UPI0037249E17
MTLKTADVMHVLLALTILVLAAHAGAELFRRLRQPPVIGEIAGGLLLGPTVLGYLLPGAGQWVFPAEGPTTSVMGAFYHLGLFLLVYLIGFELGGTRAGAERRTVVWITVAGLAVPFASGLLIARSADMTALAGPLGSPATLSLVFGTAIAVTSIPVISRIMLDIGIMRTRFARVVLSVAVLEDVVLYVILSLILAMAQIRASEAYGLWALTGVDSAALTIAYYILASLVFLGFLLWLGPRILDRLSASRLNIIETRSPVAFLIAVIFLLCVLCVGLGIDPVFGALMVGFSVGRLPTERAAAAHKTIKGISLAFFVPVYFAIVGLKLDLIHNFPLAFFAWFFAVACVVKWGSVWVGARLAGEDRSSATNLATAMNARGGPGIVLASTTFSAGVINEAFFTALVILSIITSQLAGVWLTAMVSRGHFRSVPDVARDHGAKVTAGAE